MGIYLLVYEELFSETLSPNLALLFQTLYTYIVRLPAPLCCTDHVELDDQRDLT